MDPVYNHVLSDLKEVKKVCLTIVLLGFSSKAEYIEVNSFCSISKNLSELSKRGKVASISLVPMFP